MDNQMIDIFDEKKAKEVLERFKKLGGYDKMVGRRVTRNHLSSTRVGRNDKCICGSGRKFKKCCMPRE